MSDKIAFELPKEVANQLFKLNRTAVGQIFGLVAVGFDIIKMDDDATHVILLCNDCQAPESYTTKGLWEKAYLHGQIVDPTCKICRAARRNFRGRKPVSEKTSPKW